MIAVISPVPHDQHAVFTIESDLGAPVGRGNHCVQRFLLGRKGQRDFVENRGEVGVLDFSRMRERVAVSLFSLENLFDGILRVFGDGVAGFHSRDQQFQL